MNKIFISLILFYRRYISPYKGYRCAHHYLYGGGACSDWSLEVINAKGVPYFISNLYGRLIQCHEACEKIKIISKDKSINKNKYSNDDENSNEKIIDKCCIPIEVCGCLNLW